MKDSERRPAPPVPPRRLKRKSKPLVGVTDGVAEGPTTSAIRSEPRPRLPPPPPPQRGLPRGESRPQLLPRPAIAENSSPAAYSAENRHSHSITADKPGVSEVEGVKPALSTFGTTVLVPLGRGSGKKPLAEASPRRKREKSKISRPNEYPPLFFTLQDFQEVMADVENSYSRTLRNMTSFEPTPKPRRSKISIDDMPETPEKTDEVLFRVTTTNVPFEKSLSEWADARSDPNHFIFEEYGDRRQISAQRKSKPSSTKLVLFGDDTFDREDEERTVSTSHVASRVRFRVDSPPRDENVEKISELDSLQNIDSLPLDYTPSQNLKSEVESVKEIENEDEFGDVPFDSLLDSANERSSSLCVDYSEESTSSRSDFQTILVTAMVEPVPSTTINEKPIRDPGAVEEGKEAILPNEEVNLKDEGGGNCEFETVERKSPCSETRHLESVAKCETENSAILELTNKADNQIEMVDRREGKRKVSVDESLREFMEDINNGDKSPSENLRRNSFLMNMLQGDEPDERVVCKVVATHPKTPIHGSKIDGVRVGREPSAAVEAKSKLLGELSSSFSALKLKPVNNVRDVGEKQSASDLKIDSINVGEGEIVVGVMNRDVNDYDHDYDGEDDVDDGIKYELNRNLDSVLDSNVVKCNVIEEPIEESRRSRYEPQHRSNVCSQKTDEIIDKKYVEDMNIVCQEESKTEFGVEKEIEEKKAENAKESNNNSEDNDGNNHSGNKIKENNNKKNVEVASRSSVDKCAIVLQCNNNNDNNAMTPVDVSYDQSPNNVSIIPGSVRSFVKFYEIQGETSVGLNSNDTAGVPKIKVEAVGNAPDNFTEISPTNVITQPIITEIENDIKYTIVARKPVLQKRESNAVLADQNHIVNQRSDKFDKSSKPISSKAELPESRTMPIELSKTDGKRNDQFRTGSALIRSTSLVRKEQEEMEKERRRQRRSRSSASKKPATDSSRTHSAASGIARGTQDGSTAGVTKDVVRSGTTNHSVPKSSTSTINEQYTFYCTV